MPVYTCKKKKEKYDQLILEMYTRVELPFKVGGGGGACTSHLHPQCTHPPMTACSFWLDIHARRNKSDQLLFLADIHVRRKKSMICIDHTFPGTSLYS